MSDYVYYKVIRLPFPKQILDRCETEDPWDCEDYLKENLKDLYDDSKGIHVFQITGTSEANYLDWVYEYSYGEESGAYGYVNLLTQEETYFMRRLLFENLPNIYFDEDDFRKVEYCYYNCCEPPDYYDLDERGWDSINNIIPKHIRERL